MWYNGGDNMREIKVWINDDSIYQYPHYIKANELQQYISEWQQALFQKCKEANADHHVYAVATIDNKESKVVELDIYMLPLNNEEFRKRTDALLKEKPAIIYAWHKGTAY